MNRLKRVGSYPYLNARSLNALQPEYVDPILKENMHQIHAFSWITRDMYNNQGGQGSALRITEDAIASNNLFQKFQI